MAARIDKNQDASIVESEPGFPPIYMEGVEFFQCRFAHPFIVRAPLGEHWLLYRIDDDAVVFSANDADHTTVTLEKGAIIALSGVLQHQFFSLKKKAVEKPWREEPYGCYVSEGEALLLVGRISKTQMPILPMYERLLIIQPSEHPEVAARFGKVLDWIGDELTRPGALSKQIIRRLAEINTIEIGRFAQRKRMAVNVVSPQNSADLRIIRAISAFYSAPDKPWTVRELANIAGMSRTAFAVRYRFLIGATPLRTIRQLRMQIANNELLRPLEYSTIESLAKSAGYGSEAAFIRAYAKEFGVTPGETRKKNKRS